MTNRIFVVSIMGFTVAILSLASACASLQTPNNPTTQALDTVSAVTSAVAPVMAAAAPAPWGSIVAGILGAVGVIAGIVAHSATSSASAQQTVNAVTTGLQAAATTLNSNIAPSTAASPTSQHTG
ncbi:MAG TPA: hypothetical protein VHX86_18400 [Tepidisphaeraceae bacterium]|jgi:hypothetical protein|nr:hypothetical protein [Tepidisphaeraceae bacterium]